VAPDLQRVKEPLRTHGIPSDFGILEGGRIEHPEAPPQVEGVHPLDVLGGDERSALQWCVDAGGWGDEVTWRQAAAFCQGSCPWTTLPAPPAFPGRPPGQANVYSDGSVSFPGIKKAAIGGIGVVLTEGVTLSERARDLVYGRWAGDTYRAHVPMLGPVQNSTRAELMAAIVACYCEQGVKLAVDNQATVDIVQRILDGASVDQLRRLANRDIIIRLHALLNMRGLHTFKVMKVKSHITVDQVDRYNMTVRDKFYNDLADGEAEAGTTAGMPRRRHLAAYLVRRINAYVDFVTKYQGMLIGIYRNISSLRKNEDFFKRRDVDTMRNADADGCEVIPRYAVLGPLRGNLPEWAQRIKTVVFDAKWSVGGSFYFTWLELLAWLELEGVELPGKPGERGSMIPTLDYALFVLRRQFRRILHAFARPDAADDILDSVRGCKRLNELGVKKAMGAFHATPFLDETLRERLKERIKMLLDDGVRGARKLNLGQRLPWRLEAAAPAGEAAPGGGPYRVACPHCDAGVPLADRPVRLGRGWPKVRCPSCTKDFRCGAARARCCGGQLMRCACVYAHDGWRPPDAPAAVPAPGRLRLAAAFARGAASSSAP